MRDEGEPEELPGRVIDGREQARLVDPAPTFEPVVARAVELDELPAVGTAFPPLAVHGHLAAAPLPPRNPQPLGNHQAPERLRVPVDAVELEELLRRERRPEVGELRAEERHDARALRRRHLPRASPPAVAADQATSTVGLVGALPRAHGAVRHAKQGRCFSLRETSGTDVSDDLDFLHLLW